MKDKNLNEEIQSDPNFDNIAIETAWMEGYPMGEHSCTENDAPGGEGWYCKVCGKKTKSTEGTEWLIELDEE